MGVLNNCLFVDYVPHDQVPYWLKKFDVYVALSRLDSYGVAILEAVQCNYL